MLFNGRRQSRDRLLCRHILSMVGDNRLVVSPYTAKLFDAGAVAVSGEPEGEAAAGDYCFLEDRNAALYLKKAERLVIYRWNRVYPADVTFPREALADWKLLERQDFPGSSHERITQEVYLR